MTGTSLIARIRLKTSKPLASGKPTSRMTSAGGSAPMRASASSPVATQAGSKPSVRSAYCSVSAMPDSSSTISTRGFMDG